MSVLLGSSCRVSKAGQGLGAGRNLCHPLPPSGEPQPRAVGEMLPPAPESKAPAHTPAKSRNRQSSLAFESGFMLSAIDLTHKTGPEASRGAVHTGKAEHSCLPRKHQAQ